MSQPQVLVSTGPTGVCCVCYQKYVGLEEHSVCGQAKGGCTPQGVCTAGPATQADGRLVKKRGLPTSSCGHAPPSAAPCAPARLPTPPAPHRRQPLPCPRAAPMPPPRRPPHASDASRLPLPGAPRLARAAIRAAPFGKRPAVTSQTAAGPRPR
eukprot:363325-Chlamydomonas_euryale.AAC.8